MRFKNYLESLGYTPSTINRYLSWERSFLAYFNGRQPEQLTKMDLLEYINSRELGRSSLQLLLGRLRRYYYYLEIPYPLADFKLRGKPIVKETTHLKREEVRQLVRVYSSSPGFCLESKVGVGLLSHEGLAVEELPLLKAQDIDLLQGIIQTPTDSHLAVRTLELEASQVLHLSQLLQDKSPEDKLLTYRQGQHAVNRHQGWKQEIKEALESAKLKISFINLGQLRESRIASWIQSDGILSAQYFAGHRGISSTQRYQPVDSEGLRESFEQFHPLFKNEKK